MRSPLALLHSLFAGFASKRGTATLFTWIRPRRTAAHLPGDPAEQQDRRHPDSVAPLY